jgi:pyruvate dehydrogenase E1 component
MSTTLDGSGVAGSEDAALANEALVNFDPTEIEEWIDSLEDVLHRHGPEHASELLRLLEEQARRRGINLPFVSTTAYVNTIPPECQPEFPGDREMERKIKSLVRWNAMAMVVAGNKASDGIGGHISTFASSATLYEIGFNHFFKGRTESQIGDMVYFQGHASPGMYARAFLEGRLSEENLKNFRRELQPVQGLSSYPHPWLMPNFWQFPTVSMGLGPIFSIYHARFLRYLDNRGLVDTTNTKVWAYLGDGEMDEPETLGAINLPVRENLDNLVWVVNCNLQRLDGPVRGNGKIIQELEGIFRGSGWNVIKVVWGSDWDEILANDETGAVVRRMGELVDGQYQKYVVETGDFIRKDFTQGRPDLLKALEHLSDEQLKKMRRGGHDPLKVYAAYKAAIEHTGGPTVILAKTIKGYGTGEDGEGKNVAHNVKKKSESELLKFRDRFQLPLTDEQVTKPVFYRPPADSPEMKYLHERRKALGGYLPNRVDTTKPLPIPPLTAFKDLLEGSGTKAFSTTGAFGRLLPILLRNKEIGRQIVPIIPDEARTFGLEALFAQFGIYSPKGQLYQPVDAGQMSYYKEAVNGQVLQEGINEAGAIASFLAAGTAHANVGLPMIPFYIYYSMFGFQRVGDQIWALADSRCRGFLLGATAGRTTLNGEGLQHEDGHSHLAASAVPTCMAYDPAYAYELAVIVQDGLRRMYGEGEDCFYYITVYNENIVMPAMPAGAEAGILKGMYKLSSKEAGAKAPRVRLLGSGTILQYAQAAQEQLAEFGVSSDVYSVTSYKELRKDAQGAERWNLLHPESAPKTSYVQEVLGGSEDPIVAVSDNVRGVQEQIAKFFPTRFVALGTDGFGRSESRADLRKHFEIDATYVTFAALSKLFREGKVTAKVLKQAREKLGIDSEKVDPSWA